MESIVGMSDILDYLNVARRVSGGDAVISLKGLVSLEGSTGDLVREERTNKQLFRGGVRTVCMPDLCLSSGQWFRHHRNRDECR